MTGADADTRKRQAASTALELVQEGMRVGLGTGSTATHFVRLLGERVERGLQITAVATSEATSQLARQQGIAVETLDTVPELDLAVDGADEIDPQLNLIKGGGGALLREKVVASCARRFVVIADASKRVPRLGAFALPVAVVPMAAAMLVRRLSDLAEAVHLRRTAEGAPFVTDDGLYILDLALGQIDDPQRLAARLDSTPGIAEHGLFLGMTDHAIVAGEDGVEILRP